jgi:hypothetical protein
MTNCGMFALAMGWRLTTTNRYSETVTQQTSNHAPPYPPVETGKRQLLKSLAFLRSMVIGYHECWHAPTDRQGKQTSLTICTDTMHEVWGFLSQIVAENANLVKYLERKFKKQSINWLLTSSPKKKEPKNIFSRKRDRINCLGWKGSCTCEILAWKTAVKFDRCI